MTSHVIPLTNRASRTTRPHPFRRFISESILMVMQMVLSRHLLVVNMQWKRYGHYFYFQFENRTRSCTCKSFINFKAHWIVFTQTTVYKPTCQVQSAMWILQDSPCVVDVSAETYFQHVRYVTSSQTSDNRTFSTFLYITNHEVSIQNSCR